MNTPYSDPVVTKYFDLIKSKTKAFREFYQGDPMIVPLSKLPCLILSRKATGIRKLTNAEDEHRMQLSLTVITSILEEIRDEKDLAPGISRLYELVEGRDTTTLALQEQSLLHILRNNILVDATTGLRTDLDTPTEVNFDQLTARRKMGLWTAEAEIAFIAHFTQVR